MFCLKLGQSLHPTTGICIPVSQIISIQYFDLDLYARRFEVLDATDPDLSGYLAAALADTRKEEAKVEGEQEELGNSFRVTIERSEMTDALIEAGDLSLERIAEVADGIPILKWITAAGKTALSIRDYLFVQKLAAFLADLRALSPSDRANLIERLDQEPAFANRATEALITVLDRVDSTLKANWLAKALRAYATEQITARELMRLNAVVERVLVCDIEGIVAILEKQEIQRHSDDDSAQSALMAGLAATTHGYGGGGLVPTPVYRLFKRHVLERS